MCRECTLGASRYSSRLLRTYGVRFRGAESVLTRDSRNASLDRLEQQSEAELLVIDNKSMNGLFVNGGEDLPTTASGTKEMMNPV